MRFARGFAAWTALSLFVAPATAVEKPLPPDLNPLPGRTGVHSADPVTQGSFEGTWVYSNRDGRYALWIRNEKGLPQMRLQFQSMRNPEAFESDWSGKANYFFSGYPVTFEITVTSADANRIDGRWVWNFDAGTSARLEKADIVMQRTVFGRSMTMDFTNYEKIIRQSSGDKVFHMPVVWSWSKVSKRELLWDELPF